MMANLQDLHASGPSTHGAEQRLEISIGQLKIASERVLDNSQL
jgi:hypothetical protein